MCHNGGEIFRCAGCRAGSDILVGEVGELGGEEVTGKSYFCANESSSNYFSKRQLSELDIFSVASL